MTHSGCDSLVSRFSFAVVIFVQPQQQRTSPQPTSQQPRHSHHDTTFNTFPTTFFTTSHLTNAILQAPRGHDLRGTGEGSGVAAAKAPAGARKDISRPNISHPNFSHLNLPPEFLPPESSAGSSSRLVRRGRGWHSSLPIGGCAV